ncbi:D-alanyl-D-alanine carboxypeptidase [Tsuneonella sp. YG55]|uniref:serine-type D-Ala-D-Ala carboxypeptidase n=1 Tax=Tsuneonella litorea TaxID=2976475 RepID=A0A9X3AL16_9SPHN|nr:D-alanyl-D-alanine carboxypeptidase family protein [Tsuneonella litorea]MCT2558633.1 D-alanyl-D-alanine carboxypeptidase [Tsuneonella litorea]
MNTLIKSLLAAAALSTSAGAASADRAPIEPLVPPPEVPIALLVDLSSGQTLYSREPDRRFMPASITKVMTVFTAFEMIDAGKISPSQEVIFSEPTWNDWHGVGSTMFLELNQRVTIDALLRGITTVSANDGAAALGVGLAGSLDRWVDRMNATARSIGMHDSHFGTPNGWMDEGRTFVTARDLVTLATAMITRHPDLYERYFGHKRLKFNGFEQRNHDPVTGVVDGADGIKTGFTNQAGYGFLGSAERDGRRLVMVIGGAPTSRIQKQSSRSFLEWGFQAFEGHPLFAAGTVVGEARVQGGAQRSVSLVAERPIGYDLPIGQTGKVELTIHYQGPLRAPVAKGEQVAELEIAVEGLRTSRVPLVAASDVDEANLAERLVNGVVALF